MNESVKESHLHLPQLLLGRPQDFSELMKQYPELQGSWEAQTHSFSGLGVTLFPVLNEYIEEGD